jgi:glycosyltransferase involved in cell wall biosynthesis
LYEGMINAGMSGSFVGRKVVIRDLGEPEPHSPPRCWRDKKMLAALGAFFTLRDFWQFKHLLPGSRSVLAQAALEPYDAVLVNMLYALPLLRPFLGREVQLIVDTQNYDPAYYTSMAARSRNPVLRHLCRRAIRTSERALSGLPRGTFLIHVSEADAKRYRLHRPDLQHAVVENGTDVRARPSRPEYAARGKRTLMFVGSLSSQINQDALRHFAARFWPKLRDLAEFEAVGSRPPSSVRKLCREQGWRLIPDVSEKQLDQLYTKAHWVVLPFAYGEGSKLKLVEACGQGVPVLSSVAGVCGVAHVPPLVTVSDDPEVWFHELKAGRVPGENDVRNMISFAERLAWPNLGRRMAAIAEGIASPDSTSDGHFNRT